MVSRVELYSLPLLVPNYGFFFTSSEICVLGFVGLNDGE